MSIRWAVKKSDLLSAGISMMDTLLGVRPDPHHTRPARIEGILREIALPRIYSMRFFLPRLRLRIV